MKKTLCWLLILALTLCCVPAALAAESEPVSRRQPTGLCLYDGGLLVADSGDNAIYALSGDKETRLAGLSLPNDVYDQATDGYRDGPAAEALFASPWAIVPWGGGWAVSDPENHAVRLILDGQVYTLAGAAQPGENEWFAAETVLDTPMGLAVDDKGILYIADAGAGCVYAMTPSGVVTKPLGGMDRPTGLSWYDGGLYICDTGNNRVLAWRDKRYYVLAGAMGAALEDGTISGGFADGTPASARFNAPQGILATPWGIFVADTGNSALRLIFNGNVTTLLRRGDMESAPLTPVGLALQGNELSIADPAAGLVLTVTLENVYKDVPVNAWYAAAVGDLHSRVLIDGMAKGVFGPEVLFTRAMTAALVQRYVQSRDESPALGEAGTFSDVSEGAWYAEAVAWCSGAGLVEGYPDGTFAPERPVSRQELVTLLCRLADFMGRELGAEADLSGFTDAADVAEYAQDAVAWAVSAGILRGDGGFLNPDAAANRAQACTLMSRTFAWLEA